MDARYLLLLLLAVSLSYADCIGYNDTFQVRVLDGKLRPVENASVTVTYDRGASFGTQYFTTPIRYTDQNGLLDMAIYNQGTISRTIDCNIVVNASIGGAMNSTTVIASAHSPQVDVQLNIYPLRFYVRDQSGSPLANSSVTINNVTEQTDTDGSALYTLAVGNYSYLASYLDASQSGILTITDDSQFVVKFAFYKISLNVSDDFGVPLPATLTILNKTYTLDNGFFENDKTFGQAIPYTVSYMGIETSGTISPVTDPNAMVYFDTHAPSITDITANALGDNPKLTMAITDPGTQPSGVDFSSVKVAYQLEPADQTTPWDNAVVFTTGRNQVTAEFPQLPSDRVVQFKIDANDKAGNKAEVEGEFTTSTTSVQNVTNSTKNQTIPPQNKPPAQGLPLLYIVAGVIIMILVVYLVIRIKSKAPDGG